MKVTLAKSAGFCFGVKRAVDMVYEQIEDAKERPIYTYGPIIHNEEVVKELAEKGVRVIAEDEDPHGLEPGTVIIRSHGVGRKVKEDLENAGFTIVDATCPFVQKIHRYVAKYAEEGYFVLIVGSESHPEVQGIVGWMPNDSYAVISTPQDLEDLALAGEKICIVSQTTFNYNKFKELVEIISKKRYDIVVLNTICNATKERQTEARQIAARVDAMVVIGDKRSSNTQKLFEICKEECLNTYYIQTLDDLDINQLRSVESVGITAGASTPNKIIEEVQNNVRINF